MSLSPEQEMVMNTISGLVIAKDSGRGIPGVLVVIHSSVPSTLAPSPSRAGVATDDVGLGSAITRPDGAFELSYADNDFKNSDPKEIRPDLHLSVLAPEEPGVTPRDLVLFATVLPRQKAGRNEQYIIRLPTELLQKHEIPVPLEISR